MPSRIVRTLSIGASTSAVALGLVVGPPAHAAEQSMADPNNALSWVNPQFVHVDRYGRGDVQTDVRLNNPDNPPTGLPDEQAYNTVRRTSSVLTPALIQQLIQRGSPRAMPGNANAAGEGDGLPYIAGFTYLDQASRLEFAQSTEAYPPNRLSERQSGFLSYTPTTRKSEIRMEMLTFAQGVQDGSDQLAATERLLGQGLVLDDGSLVEVEEVRDSRRIVGDWQRKQVASGRPIRAYVMACKTPYAKFRETTGFDNRVTAQDGSPNFTSLDPTCIGIGSLMTKKQPANTEGGVYSTYVTTAGLPQLMNLANTTSPNLALLSSGNWIIYTEFVPFGDFYGTNASKLPRGRVETLPSWNFPRGDFQPTGTAYVIPQSDSIAVKWRLAGWRPSTGAFSQARELESSNITLFVCDGANLTGWKKDVRVLTMDDHTMAKAIERGVCERRGTKVIDDPQEGTVDPTQTHDFLTVIPQIERIRPGMVVVARNASTWRDSKCTLPVECTGGSATTLTSLWPGTQTYYRVGDVGLDGAQRITPEELSALQRRFG